MAEWKEFHSTMRLWMRLAFERGRGLGLCMAWCGVIVQIDRSHSANRHSPYYIGTLTAAPASNL